MTVGSAIQPGGAHHTRDWTVLATVRGAGVGLVAGLAGGAVSTIAQRLASGSWRSSAAVMWLVGSTMAGAALGSSPRDQLPQSARDAAMNTAYVVGAVIGAGAAAPGVSRAGRALLSGAFHAAGSEFGNAMIRGAVGFGSTAAAAAVAVPLGMPEHFELIPR